MEVEDRLYRFADSKTPPDPFLKIPEENSSTSIVIDNGSYICRMGWSTSEDSISYKNVLAKTRKEKGKESELLVGNDISNIEAVRFNLKTPFDRNVVTQFETQETLLDYGFAHLGLKDESSIDFPIVMTEPLANPNACRASMTELLFEGYSVPKVSYGLDALFSAYLNISPAFDSKNSSFLVISVGFHTVTFIPVVEGVVATEGVRRVNIGGFHLTNYACRSMQLKYPQHVNSITIGRAEEILHCHCRIATEYTHELNMWRDRDYYTENVRRLQLPFTVAVKPPPVDPEVMKQRRQEMAKRLVEMNAKKREERRQEEKNNLKTLLAAQTLLEQGYEDKVKRMLSKANLPGVKSVSEIESLIEKTKAKIEKSEAVGESKSASVSEDQSSGGGGDNGPDAKKSKKSRDDMGTDEREAYDSWLDEVRTKRRDLLEKRSNRHQRKQQLAKRRTAASQERMRIVAQLAKSSKKDDNFGANDDDWEVYKKINKDHGDSDSEEELERLTQYEVILKEHDPDHPENVEFSVGSEEGEIKRDQPEWHQLHLATEQIRVPEILFQPSIIGHEQAGISETVEYILKLFPEDIQQRLVENVFLTGSLAGLPGLKDRLETDLLASRPFKSKFRVRLAASPSRDGFNGAKHFANQFISEDKYFLSRKDYEEYGEEYLKEHMCSNVYTRTPSAPASQEPTV